MTSETEEYWVTIKEAIQITGKSDRTFRRWVTKGKIPNRKENRKILVDLAAIGYPYIEPDIDSSQDVLDSSQDVIDPQKLIIDSLKAQLEQASSERDFLRQALAAALSKIPVIEANTTPPESKKANTAKGWRWPWGNKD